MPSTLFDLATPHPEGFREVEPSVFFGHRREAKLIDVREPSEFVGELGHAEGAELVPLGVVAQTAHEWEREAPVVLICRSGARSARACLLLLAMGFSRVMNLRGGTVAWREAGLPVRTG